MRSKTPVPGSIATPKENLPSDRLIGSSRTCQENGIFPAYICVGTASAVYEYLKENELPQNEENAQRILLDLAGFTQEEELMQTVLGYYDLYQSEADVRTIRRAAESLSAEHAEAII